MISSRYLSSLHVASLSALISKSFTTMSKRNTVPKLFKDPKFTRKGIVKPKKKDRQYDLTQPHVKNPELYYDEKIDLPLERKRSREARKANRGLPSINSKERREFNVIAQELTDLRLLRDGDSRLMINIHELQKWHADKLNSERNLVDHALKQLNTKLYLKNFRDFGVLVNLNSRYNAMDEKFWSEAALNLHRFLNTWYQYDTNALERESYQRNLITTWNAVSNAAARLKIDISELTKALYDLFAEKVGSFSTISGAVVFYTNLAKNLNKFPNDILDKIVARAENEKTQLNTADLVSLIHALSKSNERADELLNKLTTEFVNRFQDKKEQSIDRIAIVSQALANARVHHNDFKLLAENFVQSNLDKLSHIKDLCFIADSFSKMNIKNEKIYKHIETALAHSVQTIRFDNLKQIIFSTKKSDLYSQDFIDKLYNRIKGIAGELPRSQKSSLSKKDIGYLIANCSHWKTPDGDFTSTEVYYTLSAEADISSPTYK